MTDVVSSEDAAISSVPVEEISASPAASVSASSQRGSPPEERRGTLVDGEGALVGWVLKRRGADSFASGWRSLTSGSTGADEAEGLPAPEGAPRYFASDSPGRTKGSSVPPLC